MPASTNPDDINTRYQRAQQLMSGVFTKDVAFNTTLYPHWIGDTDRCWYIRQTREGQHFLVLDAKEGRCQAAFDHQALALALSAASDCEVQADNLPLTDLDLGEAPELITFTAFNKRWSYTAATAACQELSINPQGWTLSPDGRQALFVRDHNLWLHELDSGRERPLTDDGEAFYRYAGTPTVYGRNEVNTVEAIWSPDSKRIFTQLLDTRDIAVAPPIVEYVPADGSLRPKIRNPERRMAIFTDEHIEAYRFLTINLEDNSRHFIDYRPCPVLRPPYVGYFSSRRAWWGDDSRHSYFIDHERGGKRAYLVKLDTDTGKAQRLIEESSDFTVNLTPISHMHMLLQPILESNELIWFSERSGYAHLYLYELSTGRFKHAITQGDWLVRNILHLDLARRELFIQTAGRGAGRNPYYCDICRVNIDTGELTTLRSTEQEYMVCDQRSRMSMVDPKAVGVAPSGQYLVTTVSRVDQAPVSLLLDRNGELISTLETADTSGLPDQVSWPEPVMLTAADGATPIYGVVFRPSNFDPEKSYPVLDCTYNYATPVGSFSNNTTNNRHYLSAWAYAELGFIAVMIFNRGNEGLRDVVFNSYQDPVMPQETMRFRSHKEDCVAGIQELAARHSYMDIDRVGVVEFGSIPTAVTGLLLYPDFYKVGVSINAQLDSRLLGCIGTLDEGYPELEDFAGNLRGKLLLIHGMLEDVITPAMMFRLVEALQKNNKSFDMLLLPNLGHGSSSYTIQRSWEYVVEHLLGEEPPVNFKLKTVFG